MAFKRITAPSIKELFLSQMEGMILSGELKPGDRLPTERELADTMGISKTIVHEGIRELARIGFLDVVSRKGVYVADYTSTGNLDTLLAIVRNQGGVLDTKMLISLLDTRVYLECPALRALCRQQNPEHIRRLEALQEEVKKAISLEAATFAAALFAYRKAVVSLSGNCVSPFIMNAFFTPSVSAWTDYCEYIGRRQTYEVLARTTEYIRNGDAEGAVRLFTGCIEKYKGYLTALRE
ncbi:MAG: GntR family transcriptional regulator [Lachnospiraceae bacterium]|nr:GntR family transcriptional regulator [Lachnospiraceae bacterium]